MQTNSPSKQNEKDRRQDGVVYGGSGDEWKDLGPRTLGWMVAGLPDRGVAGMERFQ